MGLHHYCRGCRRAGPHGPGSSLPTMTSTNRKDLEARAYSISASKLKRQRQTSAPLASLADQGARRSTEARNSSPIGLHRSGRAAADGHFPGSRGARRWLRLRRIPGGSRESGVRCRLPCLGASTSRRARPKLRHAKTKCGEQLAWLHDLSTIHDISTRRANRQSMPCQCMSITVKLTHSASRVGSIRCVKGK